MNHYEKVYSEAGVYLGVLWFQKRWHAENRSGKVVTFRNEQWARDWLGRQVIRDAAA